MSFPRLVRPEETARDALSERSDDELMRLARAGVKAAFAVLLDAHTERARRLSLALPEAWVSGASLERMTTAASSNVSVASTYAVPDAPGTMTLAAMTELHPRSSARGPDETFQSLFATPFGPHSLAHYVAARRRQAPPVYGVSSEDTTRMDLVLDQLARFERGRRLAEGLGGTGFGLLMAGAGVGVLNFEPGLSSGEKTEAHVLGGALLGLGGLFVLGGVGSMLSKTKGEEAAAEFRAIIRAGGDPARAGSR